MVLRLEELNEPTRQFMLAEFEKEQTVVPYVSKVLSDEGRLAFPDLMRVALKTGNEASLARALAVPQYWKPTNARGASNPVSVAAERLALTEFLTWYTTGLAKRLLTEGETHAEVYRAGDPVTGLPGSCSVHELQVYPLTELYAGHRARYHPPPGMPSAFMIPGGANCHHTIRRLHRKAAS